MITVAHVTDIEGITFVADPFIVKEGDLYYLFYEATNGIVDYVSYSTSPDGLTWTYGSKLTGVAHPYPQVFKVDGEWWMTPHSSDNVRNLYHATHFPDTWELYDIIINAPWPLRDGTIFQYNGYFWMICGRTVPYEDTVLYYSPTLYGNTWTLHPSSPIITGTDHYRPGGRPIIRANAVDILLQDLTVTYGRAVRIFRLTNLTTTSCTATELATSPLLIASGGVGDWNKDGMHQLDRVDSGLSIVDGKYISGVDDIWSIGIYRDVP